MVEKIIKSYELMVAPNGMKFNSGSYLSIKANYDDGTNREFMGTMGLPLEDQQMMSKFISASEFARDKVSKLNIILNQD